MGTPVQVEIRIVKHDGRYTYEIIPKDGSESLEIARLWSTAAEARIEAESRCDRTFLYGWEGKFSHGHLLQSKG